jgi:hypothetical protein
MSYPGIDVVVAAEIATSGKQETDSGASGVRDGRFRLLVVATEVVAGSELRHQVEELIGKRDASIHVVSPALTESAFQHAAGNVDEAMAEARQRLDRSLDEIRKSADDVSGAVGDSDPLLAIEDSLRAFPADEILIVTHPDEQGRWLEDGVFERARATIEPPITHVVAERDSSGAEHVAKVEHAEPGVDEPSEEDTSQRRYNMPPFTLRELAGLFVAIVGTIVLVILAAACQGVEEGGGSDFACAARIGIAGALGLVNAAHVVGLFLFESVGYRGFWPRVFATLSLALTPLAIVVSVLIH